LTEQKLLLGIKVSISPTDYYAVQLQLVRFDRTRWMRFGDWSTTGAPMQLPPIRLVYGFGAHFMRTFLAG
jgi:hypothetical protein